MPHLTDRIKAKVALWASTESQEARELRQSTEASGCKLVGDAADRERVELQGTLRTVTLRPRGGVPALEAELYDGSGVITLVWLGRRAIAGITPGRQLRVSGRVGMHDGMKTIFNPRYELRH